MVGPATQPTWPFPKAFFGKGSEPRVPMQAPRPPYPDTFQPPPPPLPFLKSVQPQPPLVPAKPKRVKGMSD